MSKQKHYDKAAKVPMTSEALRRIDEAARRIGMSRSAYIRAAVHEQLRRLDKADAAFERGA